LLRFDALGLACLGVACQAAPTASARRAVPPSPPRVSAAPAPAVLQTPAAATAAPSPSLERLSDRLREPAWEAGTDAQLYGIGRFHALVVDFETIAKRSDGMPVGFRRFALFDDEYQLLGQYTVDKSQGGADLVEVEPRDVDGDGSDELIFYYSATDGWNPSHFGFVIATSQGGLSGYPLDIALPNGARLQGSGCWARADNAPIFVASWQYIGPDLAGNPVVLAVRDGAVRFDARGPQPVTFFGWLLAESKDEQTLQARLPERHRQAELSSPVRAPNCSADQTFVIVSHRGLRALIGGLALTAEGAGKTWPSDVPPPRQRQRFEIPAMDPKTWQTTHAPKSR
jgi:hypothetical protein